MKSILTIIAAAATLTVSAAYAHCGSCGTSASHAHASEAKAEKAQTIVDVAAGNENFSTLVAAVKAAGLVETLQGDGPFTVFAPTNEAFAALPEGTVENLLKPENRATLTSILTYHVVAGKVKASDVVKLKSAKTVQGQEVKISTSEDMVKINGAQVVMTDIEASNGVIHVIDQVILPPSQDSE
jgi:uncharacterized surface protein with fasciclin (FAS1) repeats